LLLGDRGYVSPATEAAYTRAGVNHILSISGFHVAIVALAVYQLLYLLGRCSETLMLRCNLRRVALLAGLPVVLFYLFLSGAAPATARSVVMIVLGVLALWIHRETDPVNVLIVAALLLLGINPPLLFDLSFQLSFLAIWGLIVLTPLLLRPFMRWEHGAIGKLILVPAASVAAIVATLVPVAYYFHRSTATGIIANLFIVPLMGYGAVVVGFAALPFAVAAPGVAQLLLACAAFLVYLSDRIILFLAQAPLLPHWSPTRLDLLLFFLLMTSLTFLSGRRFKGVAAAILLTHMVAGHIPWGGAGERGLEVTFFSLGQAEATLIRFPAGETLLVDGGGSLREGGADTGERLLAPALWALGVDRLDVVALTHPHPDHLRGLRFIVENFPVGQFWESGLHEDSSDYMALRAAITAKGIPVGRINRETAPRPLGEGRIEPLAPHPAHQESGETNDDSLVFRLVWRDLALLFTGDIGVATEARLLAAPERLKADILKVPHHGSRYSSSEAFLDAVRPRVALIAAGYGNTFRLPAPQTLARLARRRIAVYRTDLDGTIFLRSTGQGFTVSTINP
jgi:competence protein ComEC